MRGPVLVVVLVMALFALGAPSPARAQGVSLESFTFGFEAGLVKQDLGSEVALLGSVLVDGVFTDGSIENKVGDSKVTRGLAKVTYHPSPIVNPYLVLGLASLSFDDDFRVTSSTLASVFEETVEFSDSGIAYGIGAEGKLLKLPAAMTLGYGVRFLGFSTSDTTTLLVEELSQFDDATFITDVSYTEWSIALTVSRDIPMRGNLVLTPYGGLRHASVHMNASTAIDYRPYIDNRPVPIEGSYDRPIDGNLNSVVIGCTGALGRALTGYLQFVALGETGAELGVAYRF
jgi:hypothetical protein